MVAREVKISILSILRVQNEKTRKRPKKQLLFDNQKIEIFDLLENFFIGIEEFKLIIKFLLFTLTPHGKNVSDKYQVCTALNMLFSRFYTNNTLKIS